MNIFAMLNIWKKTISMDKNAFKEEVYDIIRKYGLTESDTPEIIKCAKDILFPQIQECLVEEIPEEVDQAEYFGNKISDCMEEHTEIRKEILDAALAVALHLLDKSALLTDGFLKALLAEVSEKDIKLLSSRTLELFEKKMPPINREFPNIYITTEDAAVNMINDINEKTDAHGVFIPNLPVLYIHGSIKDSIIVFKDILNHRGAFSHEMSLIIMILNALGKFYTVNSEPEDWYVKYQDNIGYQFWNNFASVSIRYSVLADIDANDVLDKEDALEEIQNICSELSLPMLIKLSVFFAALLVGGRYDNVSDPLEKFPEKLQPLLRKLKAILEEQLKRDNFWITTEEVLKDIENIMSDLAQMLES